LSFSSVLPCQTVSMAVWALANSASLGRLDVRQADTATNGGVRRFLAAASSAALALLRRLAAMQLGACCAGRPAEFVHLSNQHFATQVHCAPPTERRRCSVLSASLVCS
jgi:hypothetical protein